jgi:hypothetical protein
MGTLKDLPFQAKSKKEILRLADVYGMIYQ